MAPFKTCITIKSGQNSEWAGFLILLNSSIMQSLQRISHSLLVCYAFPEITFYFSPPTLLSRIVSSSQKLYIDFLPWGDLIRVEMHIWSLRCSFERGGNGARGTRGGSGAPALSSIYMKRDDRKNSGYKPQPYTNIIPSFVSLRLYLHI